MQRYKQRLSIDYVVPSATLTTRHGWFLVFHVVLSCSSGTPRPPPFTAHIHAHAHTLAYAHSQGEQVCGA